jgi:hypothetical protein
MMATRAMIAKCERAARQRRELAQAEFTKPIYAGRALTMAAGDTKRAQLDALVMAFAAKGGKVQRAGRETETVTRKVIIRREHGIEVVRDKVVRPVHAPIERKRGGSTLGDSGGRSILLPGKTVRGYGMHQSHAGSRLIKG